MSRARRLLGVLLVILYVAFSWHVSFSTFDFSWSPSYFDDDDDDFLSLWTSRFPVAALELFALLLVSVKGAVFVAPQVSSRSPLSFDLALLRAPPVS